MVNGGLDDKESACNAQDPGSGEEEPLEKEWLPTPVFLPGEFHVQRSLVGYSPQGHKESDMTEQLILRASKCIFSNGLWVAGILRFRI